MKILPLFDRVLLKQVEETTNQNGLYVPKQSSDKSLVMTVIETGNKCISVTTGDRVIIHKYAGTEINFESGKYFIAKEIDILATIKGDDN
ncbi:MAG: co-chaperone GroES [Firmicutes bacterium]|nr:co-chaperone GroES [Bacillota bacterium]